jgi:hypothetical protein
MKNFGDQSVSVYFPSDVLVLISRFHGLHSPIVPSLKSLFFIPSAKTVQYQVQIIELLEAVLVEVTIGLYTFECLHLPFILKSFEIIEQNLGHDKSGSIFVI